MRSASAAPAILFLVVFTAVLLLASATEFLVGDDSGWSTDVDYEAWAGGKKFFVGDTLVFNYEEGYHTVVKVDGAGFAECSVSPNNGTLTSGSDRIVLATPGNKWYICGVADHCSYYSQKLKITVLPRDAYSYPPYPSQAPTANPPEWGLPPLSPETPLPWPPVSLSPIPAPWMPPMPPMPAPVANPPEWGLPPLFPAAPAPWSPMPPMPAPADEDTGGDYAPWALPESPVPAPAGWPPMAPQASPAEPPCY
ncbi:hypothetical protein H6P81_004994 [Aristolochia fimbriata]|uniref:Phytocyanin domain-containing protein n=1 Tax=Aristolochia fimbriata TaxID=158543 RepID=A0AAV7ET88_ARIFI|nr:hypothetical protein H6P81_004994 [Aristolochia fimbriata]